MTRMYVMYTWDKYMNIKHLAIFVLVTLATGCDPVSRVEQTIVLRVSALEAEEDNSRLIVSIREFHQKTAKDTELEKLNPQREFQLYPWTPDVRVDDSSLAKIEYGETTLAPRHGKTPPSTRDLFTCKVFHVRVSSENGHTEELVLQMCQGESVTGDMYQVSVVSISSPSYANPD